MQANHLCSSLLPLVVRLEAVQLPVEEVHRSTAVDLEEVHRLHLEASWHGALPRRSSTLAHAADEVVVDNTSPCVVAVVDDDVVETYQQHLDYRSMDLE